MSAAGPAGSCEIVSRWGGGVIGIDYLVRGRSVAANLGERPKVDIIQADVFNLPFRKDDLRRRSSRSACCITRATRARRSCRSAALKNGGEIAVWLYYYTDKLYNAATDFWRA